MPTSLEQQKKRAKELLKAFHSGDAAALHRVRLHLPDKPRITLADAQFVLAREAGFESWPRFKANIEAASRPITESVRAEFHQAFVNRDAAAVRELLRREPAARAMINAPVFSFGSSPLVHFAGQGNLELIDVLLEFGADPNQRSDWPIGPWHALHSADPVIADRLIAAGAEIDACAAAHLGRVDELRRLLDAAPERVHERGGDGQMPLHFATSRAVIDLLLERGADIDARDFDHHGTAAEWMIGDRTELARYLVERGASADIFLASALGLVDRLRELLESRPGLLELRTHHEPYAENPPGSYHIYTWSLGQNLSPLQVAARFKQHEAVALLRSYATEKERFLAACALGDAAEAKAILRANPRLIEGLTAAEQRTLADAAWATNAGAVELMLDVGFDPAVTGSNGGTLLHCAAWEGSVECVQIALRHDRVRALIDVRDPVYGGTPLGWCCHGAVNCGRPDADHVGVARILIAAGAEVTPEIARGAPPVLSQLFQER